MHWTNRPGHWTNRPGASRDRRAAFMGALATAAVVAIAGCGAGQVTQTSNQEASINGTNAEVDGVDLRNVYFLAEPTDSGEARYGQVRLAFTVVNNSAAPDRLVSVESPAATSMTIDGPEEAREILPGTTLAAGQPIEQLDTATAPDQPVSVRGEFPADAIRPGLTYPVTFTFERVGAVTLNVPFDAWVPAEPLPTERPLPPLPAHP